MLLYELHNLIKRDVDNDKLIAVLNKATRMTLKLTSKSEFNVIDLEKKELIKNIRTQVAVQRANLWIRIARLKTSEQTSVKEKKTYDKDRVGALKNDLQLLKVRESPRILAYTDELDSSVKMLIQNLKIGCIARKCCGMFAANTEEKRHLRNDPTLTLRIKTK